MRSERSRIMPAHAILQRVRLTLARSKEFPEGSSQYGYELIAPLDHEGYLDIETWKLRRADCTVRHFAEGQDDQFGMLVHKAGGRDHAHWVFDYDSKAADDDEAGFMFGSHRFIRGEYVSVRGSDGKTLTFAVSAVEPLVPA
jgi:hypothetical protein